MPQHFFFWAGLAAVAGGFLGAALLAMGLVAGTERARLRLVRAQSVALAALLAFTAAAAWLLRARLAPWLDGAAPGSASALLDAERSLMSVLLLGLALVLNALLAAFAWVRRGRAGNALRAVVWAVPALQLVLGGNELLGAFQALHLPAGTPGAGGPEAIAAAHADAARAVMVTGLGAAAVLPFSAAVGWLRRRARVRADLP